MRTEVHTVRLRGKLGRYEFLGRPGLLWEVNIKIYLKEIGFGKVN
jgi:hypothetical protein